MLLYRMTLRHHLQISRRIHSRVILAKLKYTMTTILKQLPLLPEFKKFIIASKSGRRVMPSGKKIRPGTIEQYECVYKLLQQYQLSQHQPMRITLLHRSSLRTIRKEKNYWSRFFKNFAAFLYKQKQCFDFYVQKLSGRFLITSPLKNLNLWVSFINSSGYRQKPCHPSSFHRHN